MRNRNIGWWNGTSFQSSLLTILKCYYDQILDTHTPFQDFLGNFNLLRTLERISQSFLGSCNSEHSTSSSTAALSFQQNQLHQHHLRQILSTRLWQHSVHKTTCTPIPALQPLDHYQFRPPKSLIEDSNVAVRTFRNFQSISLNRKGGCCNTRCMYSRMCEPLRIIFSLECM